MSMTETQTVSAEQADRLIWLGRYTERVVATLRNVGVFLDRMIDEDPFAYRDFCERLSIPSDLYADAADFEAHYLYDPENPDSVYSNLSRAYDNALVLRSFISSETLSYIEMALNALKEFGGTQSAFLECLQIVDLLLAFWGSLEESGIDPERRALILSGKYMELIDLGLRLELPGKVLQNAASRLELYRGRIRGTQSAETAPLAAALAKDSLTEEERTTALTLVNRL